MNGWNSLKLQFSLSSLEIIFKLRDYSVCVCSGDSCLASIPHFSGVMFLQLLYKIRMDFDLLGGKFLKFYILFKCQAVLPPHSWVNFSNFSVAITTSRYSLFCSVLSPAQWLCSNLSKSDGGSALVHKVPHAPCVVIAMVCLDRSRFARNISKTCPLKYWLLIMIWCYCLRNAALPFALCILLICFLKSYH